VRYKNPTFDFLETMKLHIGQQVPYVSLPDQDNTIHNITDDKGKWVLIYFYPKDDTPGCTTEACAIRDNLPHFQQQQVVVLGISVDSVSSHKKFAQKYGLPFTLLSDVNKKVVNDFDVWQEKSFMGRKYMGIVRTSFLINPEGTIVKIYEKVNPSSHIQEVLTDVEKFQK